MTRACACGAILSSMTRGDQCLTCFKADQVARRRYCCDCDKRLANGTQGDRCLACFKAVNRRPDRFCGDCGAKLFRNNRSGLCRAHTLERTRSDPEINARRIAASREASRRPEAREKARISASMSKRNVGPEAYAAWSANGKRNYSRTIGAPEVRAKRLSPEATTRRGKLISATALAWCPEEHRAEYLKMRRKVRMPAEEARRMMLDLIARKEARRLAAMSPFERQMEALSKGRGLVERPVFKSLDGVRAL